MALHALLSRLFVRRDNALMSQPLSHVCLHDERPWTLYRVEYTSGPRDFGDLQNPSGPFSL